jgi:hypothetical protein
VCTAPTANSVATPTSGSMDGYYFSIKRFLIITACLLIAYHMFF